MTSYKSILEITVDLLDILRPPERLTVSQTAAKYRYLNNKGAYVGPWPNSITPYMVEPMDMLGSRHHDGVILVGPAQAGKTEIMLNWAAHSIKSDPMDLIIYSPTMASSRDFSIRRVARMNRDSREIGELLHKSRDSDNKFDKHYTTGTMLTMSYPSIAEFAGKPVPRVALTDYDRMDDDIEGEGSPYDLASKRTTTYGSFKMAFAESSPSRPVEDLRWIAKTPHEAPPCKGIFALYNRGDRRRWVWPCPHCDEFFEGTFEMLQWDSTKPTDIEQSESVTMTCPKSGCVIHQEDRHEMQQWGTWLIEGQAIDKAGRKTGVPARSIIASYWLRGVAAAFTSWKKLVSTFIAAEREFTMTGSDDALKKFYNTDLAEPYVPQGDNETRLPEYVKSRAEPLAEKHVPAGVRFLVATVDVQKNMWVVQIHGVSPGKPYDVVVVDRFNVQKSKRVDHDGERLWVKPATHLEDWDQLTEEVIDRTYPLDDGSGRQMMIKMTVCDSGGYSRKRGESVTVMAYDYYRSLRKLNKHGRFHLVKGDGKPGQPRTRISYPDAASKDKFTAARGDVPVMMLNSNLLKDTLNNRIDCIEPGKGMIRFPDWLPNWFFEELCSESRTSKGWENPSHSRNEAWDLLYYMLGVCASKLLQVEHIDWANPPSWAKDWDFNDMVSAKDSPKAFVSAVNHEYDLSKLAEQLG